MNPSKEALEAAREMARDAAANDGWMHPLYEEKGRDVEYNEFVSRNTEAWEETCHFDHYYGTPLMDAADAEIPEDCRGSARSEDRLYLWLDLKEALWDEYAKAVGMFEGWRKAQGEAE